MNILYSSQPDLQLKKAVIEQFFALCNTDLPAAANYLQQQQLILTPSEAKIFQAKQVQQTVKRLNQYAEIDYLLPLREEEINLLTEHHDDYTRDPLICYLEATANVSDNNHNNELASDNRIDNIVYEQHIAYDLVENYTSSSAILGLQRMFDTLLNQQLRQQFNFLPRTICSRMAIVLNNMITYHIENNARSQLDVDNFPAYLFLLSSSNGKIHYRNPYNQEKTVCGRRITTLVNKQQTINEDNTCQTCYHNFAERSSYSLASAAPLAYKQEHNYIFYRNTLYPAIKQFLNNNNHYQLESEKIIHLLIDDSNIQQEIKTRINRFLSFLPQPWVDNHPLNIRFSGKQII